MINSTHKLSTKFLNLVNNNLFILKLQCLLCRTSLTNYYSNNYLCSNCYDHLPKLCYQCILCNWPLPGTGKTTICRYCIKNTNKFTQIVIPLDYSKPVDKLIHKFKYNSDLSKGRILANILYNKILDNIENNKIVLPDVIIPVPIHKYKLSTRGFNQTLELARYIKNKLNQEYYSHQIKLDNNLITKFKPTIAQMGLNKLARSKNIKSSFCLNYNPQNKYQSAVILDDIVTTGSTVHAIYDLLKSVKINNISLWAIARSC